MAGPATDLHVKRIVTFDGKGTLKAFCDLAIDNRFLIKGLRVVDGKQGLFVSMPRQQGKDGKWYDTVRPLTKEAKAEVGRVVLDAYREGIEAGEPSEETAEIRPRPPKDSSVR